MQKLIPVVCTLLLICSFASGQLRAISGQVRDDKGDSVSFATITETNTRNAVTADIHGNFLISIRGNRITISAADFQTQTLTVMNGDITISLTRAEGQLSEVIVTALGIRRSRNQLGYAAQQVSGIELSRNRGSNFISSLSGKIAGLDIRQTNALGGSTNAVIRGFKSITGDNQALLVIDGVPFNNANTNTFGQQVGAGGFDYGNVGTDINPDDIESVTVLKGAAASALYGSQGANGVILVSTKKGSKGLGITINSGFGFGAIDKSTFVKYQKEYGGGYGMYYEDPSGYFLYRDIDNDGNPDLVVPTSEDASYGGRFDPTKMVYQWDAFDPSSPNFGKARPWQAADSDPSAFFKKSFSYNQSIFIDGGSDKGSFKLGYTRTGDKGILPNSKVNKNVVNFAGTLNLTEKLTAGASVNYSTVEGKGRYQTGYDGIMTNFRQWWQVNVDIKEQEAAYFRTRQNVTWNWVDPTDLVPIYWDNVYFTRNENFETDRRNRVYGNVHINYKITGWLNMLGRITVDSYDELREERMAISSVALSRYDRINRSYTETNYDLLLSADKNLSEEISIKGLLGGTIRREHTESINATTNGGLIVPRVYALSNSLNTPNAPVEFDGTSQVNGIFAGATVSWKDMVTLDATIRRDASSTLPDNQNTYYYPSISGGFVFSKLMPRATASWLSYGKLRLNHAQVGNDAPIYSVHDVYRVVPPYGGNPQTTVTDIKNNPNLKPERTRSSELGLEMAFFKNRLGFDASYYSARSFEQIMPVIVSTATGYNAKFLNAATVDNKGIELSVFATPIKKNGFAWNVNANWSRNRNKVVELFEGSENLVLAGFQSGVSNNATLGLPFGTLRGSNFIYKDGQRSIDDNGYYLVSTTFNEVIGDPNPDWTGSINNSFEYKNFSLSFLVDAKWGGDIFSQDLSYGLATGIYPETAGMNDLGNPSRDPVAQGGGIILPGIRASDGKPNETRVSNENFGLLGYYYNPTAAFVYDAGFAKLREAILSYSLPKKMVNRLKPFKGIDISVIGKNLWLIHKNLPYSDPEDAFSTASNLQGHQDARYPSVRSFAVNVKFRF